MHQEHSASRNELLDSLLHSDKIRVVKGIICGLTAGLLMLVLTTLFTPPGASKLWWFQLTASAIFGGDASRYEGISAILVTGAVIHFFMSGLLGLIYGKITQSTSLRRLLAYGLVLGALCWLSSNMFAPDVLNVAALGAVGQWLRMFLFQSYTLSLSFFMYILVRKN